jgi:hypothetical protein
MLGNHPDKAKLKPTFALAPVTKPVEYELEKIIQYCHLFRCDFGYP